ncbi:hypothetical protein F1C16_05065 [Hymenobacter sp. NBH84]|uniref:hypothetical protein n=1 Tax=Hymenobacter sp. NBH84 TaxID=2596915 RepID=UPI0016254327|nr:hypothetical protein [Hymenobacter sp. NBH84]QNE38966.1 hypothetical protein F1C16_05065 [Hymenobacter sp. NBH84]
MKKVIGGKLYNTATATLVAGDDAWNGQTYGSDFSKDYLYKTQKGNFFLYHTTRMQGETEYIKPVTKEEAMEIFEEMDNQRLEYAEAFGVEPQEA